MSSDVNKSVSPSASGLVVTYNPSYSSSAATPAAAAAGDLAVSTEDPRLMSPARVTSPASSTATSNSSFSPQSSYKPYTAASQSQTCDGLQQLPPAHRPHSVTGLLSFSSFFIWGGGNFIRNVLGNINE